MHKSQGSHAQAGVGLTQASPTLALSWIYILGPPLTHGDLGVRPTASVGLTGST